jgi:hypothetical protein
MKKWRKKKLSALDVARKSSRLDHFSSKISPPGIRGANFSYQILT